MAGTATQTGRATGYLRHIMPIACGGGCLLLLGQELGDFAWRDLGTGLSDIRWQGWALAVLATAISLGAAAQYDVIAHRHMQTPLSGQQARRGGATAVALGQLTGFGPLVGLLVRWYLAPGLRRTDVAAVTGFVTLAFLGSLAILSMAVFLPLVMGAGLLAIATGGMAIGGSLVVLWLLPKVRIKGRIFAPPTVRAGLSIFALTTIDLGFAALALWALLPAGSGLGFWTLAPVFCLALGAGLVSGLPGGAGPFELVLLSLLPAAKAPELIAALVAYRGVYCLLPALIAGIYLAIAQPKPCQRATQQTKLPAGPRAEAAIARQSETLVLCNYHATAQAIVTRQSVMLHLGAHKGCVSDLLAELETRAARLNRWPCLYKLSAQDAGHLRRAGWVVAATCGEAFLDPANFSIDGPEHRQLRRALRRAEKAGVRVRALHVSDRDEMARINRDWVHRHGPERGVTMGRFCHDWLADKPLYGAFVDGHMVAFASAVTGQAGQSLDLMRNDGTAPPGTMHLLCCALIDNARRQGAAEFSLAAVPHPRLVRFDRHSAGLLRFKQSFAPHWRPLYMAAPNHLVLAVCAADIWWSVRHPPPIMPRQSCDGALENADFAQSKARAA